MKGGPQLLFDAVLERLKDFILLAAEGKLIRRLEIAAASKAALDDEYRQIFTGFGAVESEKD
jgi:hypothetical protein